MVIEVGSAIAKSILKLWLKDSTIAQDVTSSLVDLIKSRTSDVIAQQRGRRQFEEIGEKVAESLIPIFEVEGARFDEGTRTAVAYSVAETFNTSKITSELLVESNLDPTRLEKHIIVTHPTAAGLLGEAATAFYLRIIRESCTYIVDIASHLPSFTERSFAEVLKRQDEIIHKCNEILEDLRKMREQLDPRIETERFEIEYRQAVARNLDVLQLTGTDVSLTNRRHQLSVAYITLSVMKKLLPFRTIGTSSNGSQADIRRDIVLVDTALADSHRLLIRGSAGSGKTTLLQWIAVRASTRTFQGKLLEWNNSLPFYIRLRHFVQSDLPRPEAFPGFVAPAIADTMPRGWVHLALKSGRAIVLVDGVDEIPVSRREDVHTWLTDLMETYKEARFIVTSRPHVIEEGWMSHEGLSDAELQSMGLTDIYLFIDHWHEAVRQELYTDEEKNELRPLAEQLKENVRHNPAIRTLATSPLLCAMLCALNRERRQQLPVNRIELYKACCALLLERRDKESRVDLSDYPELSYSQKQRLLEDLAYWMMQENLSAATISAVDERFTSKLAQMPGISQETTGAQVRRMLVERAGIIREPVEGQIDFTHRTFQEFFAAQAALDAMDIGMLVAKAGNDKWREVIILAAGLASKAMCEQLIQGLIKRGDQEKKYRYQLHLIAVSCLETAVELGPEVKAEVEKRLRKLVPPKNMTDAKALAAAGELAVNHLAKREGASATTNAACVRALALIAGDAALDKLEEYANDSREAVVNELLKAWDSFDRETYARRVLSRTFRDTSRLRLERLPSVDGIQYFTNLTELDLAGCEQISDLSPLASLTQLKRLDLAGCKQISNLGPLASLTQLTELDLVDCEQVSDLGPLASLTQLIELDLTGCKQINDLSPLASLTQLAKLYLVFCEQVGDLSPLASLTQLAELDLAGCKQISNLGPLASLTQLKWLSLAGCKQASDLSPLASLKLASELDLAGCKQISNLGPLASLTQLTILSIALCKQVRDLSPLASLTRLTELDLALCKQVGDLSPLTSLIQLTRLNLASCKQVRDLSPLASLTQLTNLDLADCKEVSDLGPLASLTQLTNLDLADCKEISDLSALMSLSGLKALGLSGIPNQIDVLHNTINHVEVSRDRIGFGKWIMTSDRHSSLYKADRRKRSYEFIAYVDSTDQE